MGANAATNAATNAGANAARTAKNGSRANVAVVVFTRDLRVRDNPALSAAVASADAVLTVFVLDDDVLATRHASANRQAYLADALTDLGASLAARGGGLVVRRGRFVDEVMAAATEVGASAVHLSDDVSAFAQRRLVALERSATTQRIAVHAHPGVTVVPAGAIRPSGGAEFKVFTPYHRRWLEARWRSVLASPRTVPLPAGIEIPTRLAIEPLRVSASAPRLPTGGETAALARLKLWAASSLDGYATGHDDLAADATSHVSAALHFGCLSPLEVAMRLRARPGGAPFLRQLCWRDFFHQILAARPDVAHRDFRPRAMRWRDDPAGVQAWREGRTGFPLVDAGMRQLLAEGFMHNRARMVVASFLTKDLAIDWRVGAAHFLEHLVDGDIALNQLNWQWVAGTGSDTNPHRTFNPTVQSRRFDLTGAYIRRYVAELATVPAPEIHDPSPATRLRYGYSSPLVDHALAIAEYRSRLEP